MSDERISQTSGMALFQLGGAAIGTTVGAFLGNPQLGLKVGRKLGTLGGTIFYAIRNNQKNKDQTDLERHTVQSSAYGAAIPLMYGTVRTTGNVIWATDPVSAVYIGETESQVVADFAVAFGKGEAIKVLRIFANGAPIFTASDEDLTGFQSDPLYRDRIKVYLGSATQPVDPTIEAIEGVGNVMSFKNTIYIVFRQFSLKAFDNQVPLIEADITMSASEVFEKETYSEILLDGGQLNNFIISNNRTLAFIADTAGAVYQLNRANIAQPSVVFDIPTFLANVSGTAVLNGHIAIDENPPSTQSSYVYFCAVDGADSFFGRASLGGMATNFSALTVGGQESEIYLTDGFIFTADAVGAGIRCYGKTEAFPCPLLWSRSGPHASAVPGNFVRDFRGDFWLISYVDADPDSGGSSRFFLTRFTTGGGFQHYTYTGEGKCKNITTYPSGSNLLFGGGGSDVLLKATHPASGEPTIVDTLAGVSGENSHPCFLSQPSIPLNGFLYTSDGTNIYEIDPELFTVHDTFALADYSITGTLGGWGYDALNRCVWVVKDGTNDFYKLFIDRYTEDAPTLGSVINDLCQRAGLLAGEIDTTDTYLTSTTITGLIINERSTAQQILDRLLMAYSVGKRESFQNGYSNIKIQFLARGGSPVASIAENQLGAGDGSSEDVPWLLERDPEQDLPRVVTIRYISKAQGYREDQQSARFDASLVATQAELDLALPIVLFPLQARRLADILLMSLYTESNAVRLSLPPSLALLEPEDVVVATYGGIDYRLRVASSSLSPSARTEVVFVQEHPETYESLATIQDPIGVGTNPVVVPEDSAAFFLDIPCCKDSDDVPGLYVVAGPMGGGSLWDKAILHKSSDGVAFVPITALTEIASWGQTQDALADFSANVWDTTSSVTVLMVSGTLSTATDAELVADRRKNLFAIGSPSTGWELVQVATVTAGAPIGGNPVYILTRFLRGRFGTEWRTASHELGEIVIHLDFENGVVTRINTAIGEIDAPRYYKAVTVGARREDTPSQGFTNTMVCLKPYAPTNPIGTRHAPDTNDWSVAFTGRRRKGFDLIDGSDIALGESVEQYEADILDGFEGPVLRTIVMGPGLPSLSGVDILVDATGIATYITRASGSWIADNFVAGQWVDLAGFSDADNNNRFQVVTVYEFDLVLSHGPRRLVTEVSAAGRTVTSATPGFVYTAAQQATDGGVKAQFYCNIYQVSGRSEIDRGYVLEANIS